MFTMLGLILPGSPAAPIEVLAEKVQALFGRVADFRFEYEVRPFNTERNLMLRWNDWSARLFSETADDDETVAEDSAEIARILGKRAPARIADCTHRVRVLFHDDPQEQHIDDMVEMVAMLEALEGAIIFDPQKNDLVK